MGGLGRQAPGGSFVFLIGKGNVSRLFGGGGMGVKLSSLAVAAGVSPAKSRPDAADTAATTELCSRHGCLYNRKE
jgi:hypothetical protein